MAVKGEWIGYGDQTGYYAFPERASGPLPGVVVIQEVMGVNDNIEDIARRIAASGYAVLAPDIYAANGARPEPLRPERIDEAMAFMATMAPASRFDPAVREAEMAKLPEPKRARVAESFGKMFSMPGAVASFVAPLRKAVAHLRAERAQTRGQKVGCVGFCMGGALSALLACEEPELSAAAVFYGTAPEAERIARVRCPVIGFFGERDQRVNAGIPAFEKGLREAGAPFEYKVYEGANHGFFNDTSPAYDVRAARDSFARLLAFFSRHLCE